MEDKEPRGTLRLLGCSFPTPEFPFYHARLRVELPGPKEWQVQRVQGNGGRIRDFKLFNDGQPAYNNACRPGAVTTLIARLDWENDGENRVEVQAADVDSQQIITLAESFRSPGYGGYWDRRWKYYASTVLTENKGLARANEPVHVTLGLYADRLTAPEREVRVVAVEPLSGLASEVPSQVYGVSTWDERTDEHCQPTTTLEVAFLADVAPRASKVYLIFYGNPDAPATEYPTDLVVTGEGFGLTVENSFYRIRLQATSGAIDEIVMKMGKDQLFEHHLETNGAVHWNPDVYAPPREWTHTSDWDPPAGSATIRGPIFLMTKRWGPMPQYPEVQVSVTYVFYAHNPAVIMSSTMDVEQDINVQALRNGEIVFNHDVFREFAWKQPGGEVGSVVIKERPRHPVRGLDIPADTPWFALYNRELGCAFGAANLEVMAMRRRDGLVRFAPWTYMHWGPWVYVCRPLIYTFATNNPQRVMFVPGGSTYHEKVAYFPFRVGAGANPFEFAEQRQAMLADPLDQRTEIDTDARAPEGWVPPILVEEFEEMEDR